MIFFCFQVVSELDGKDINEVICEGMGKLASMPSGIVSYTITSV